MIDEIKVTENKERFIGLVKTLTREGADIDGLISKLENSDFFIAPASLYFGSYRGGLCEFALKTFDNFTMITEGLKNRFPNLLIDPDSITIVSLFYSFYKMNFYTLDTKNVKVYSDFGSKTDNHGRFDWEAQDYYRVKDPEDRFIYGTKGEASEFMLRYFIPLTLDEARALLNGTRNTEDGQNFLPEVFAASPLTTILSAAIMLTNYIVD